MDSFFFVYCVLQIYARIYGIEFCTQLRNFCLKYWIFESLLRRVRLRLEGNGLRTIEMGLL